MTLARRLRLTSAALAATVLAALAVPAVAQDITDAHLKAARAAVAAIHATDIYDAILPQAALALQNELIQKNPDLQQLITETVSEKALALASRRADLEREVAMAYARVFPESDLTAIAAFYNSESGKKLLSDGPIVTREVGKAAEIWQRGVARDLAQEVGKVLAAKAPSAVAPAPQAADPTQPVQGTSN